jgi:hypothetical protein
MTIIKTSQGKENKIKKKGKTAAFTVKPEL